MVRLRATALAGILVLVTWPALAAGVHAAADLADGAQQVAQPEPETRDPQQPPPADPQPPLEEPAEREPRPATTSFFGDTGLWYVPTAEVLGAGEWSVSAYRANWDREAGFTDISHFAATFAVGLGGRAELFGSWRFNTRIARRVRPLFFEGDARAGGLVNEYPLVRDGWSGDNVGDLLVGAKVNLLSEGRDDAAAVAVRGVLTLPTGSEDAGVSTGQVDVQLDAVVSKEVAAAVELAGYGGVIFRGNPEGISLSNGLRWGVGAGFPSRSPVRVMTELRGEAYFDGEVTATRQLTGIDGTLSPLVTPHRNPVDATLAVLWQAPNGFFIDASLTWTPTHDARSAFGLFEDKSRDTLGRQIRVGYHPGVRTVPVPPPPPPPPPPPEPRPPTVKARCEPCTVETGGQAQVIADAQHPDGLALTYRWSAPAGTFADPTARETIWTAPMQEGPVPVTVTVEDPRGLTAADTVTIQVVQPAIKEFVFEDVHFDFDRYTLRPEATRLLDEVVTTLRENPEVRLEVEGHTCNIGTAEYNLALGERRAHAVRDYLAERGIGAERLATVSYGEERPRHDNTREETRRLNRRAALVVRIK